MLNVLVLIIPIYYSKLIDVLSINDFNKAYGLIIIFGSLMALKVFDLDLTTAVGIALFGATIGAFSAYIYLVHMF